MGEGGRREVRGKGAEDGFKNRIKATLSWSRAGFTPVEIVVPRK